MPIPEFSFIPENEISIEVSRSLGEPASEVRLLRGGKNNRVYIVRLKGSRNVILKNYFKSANDTRDRLKNEFAALHLMWSGGIRNVAEPLAMNTEKNFGIYSFLDGEPFFGKPITQNDVNQVRDFILKIQSLKNQELAPNITLASEAIFSLNELFENLKQRLDRLALVNDGPLLVELKEFLRSALLPAFERLMGLTLERYKYFSLSAGEKIPKEEQILSPSDTGFHNALKNSSGTLLFYDFEYFGWDDPAKLISDFLLQPEFEYPGEFKSQFKKDILESLGATSHLAKRLEAYYPLFGLKWCTILLNEFLKTGLERRAFATENLDVPQSRQVQLNKAKRMLKHTLSQIA